MLIYVDFIVLIALIDCFESFGFRFLPCGGCCIDLFSFPFALHWRFYLHAPIHLRTPPHKLPTKLLLFF